MIGRLFKISVPSTSSVNFCGMLFQKKVEIGSAICFSVRLPGPEKYPLDMVGVQAVRAIEALLAAGKVKGATAAKRAEEAVWSLRISEREA